ncbi:MAG: polysaccharide biosynthesis tyrosine autokinase [Rubellimicrobium sp.]|nr:polysaccharide biosynthesis tyrosine autokinase [Rubellimicrobium sp.]
MSRKSSVAAPAVDVGRDDNDEIDLLALARTLWRGWPIILLCAAIAVVVGWYRANIASVPIYSATTTMMVTRDNDPRATDATSAFFGYGGVNQSAMSTEMAIVTSREVVGKLVDRLDLTASPLYNPWLAPPPEPAGPVEEALASLRHLVGDAKGLVRDALTGIFGRPASDGISEMFPEPVDTPEQQRQDTISMLQGVLSASFDDRSYLFFITATTPDPLEAVRLANVMAEVYRDDNQQQKVAAAEASAVWLSDRVAELRREIDGRQADINARRAENALTTSDSGLTGFQTQLATAEGRRFDTQRALSAAQETVARLDAAAGQGADVRAEAASDAQLRTLARGITAGDDAAQARFDLRFGQLQQQAQSEVERLTAALASVNTEITALTDQIARTGEAAGDIRQLEQDLQSAQLLYDTFSTQLREVTLQLGSQKSDVRILSDAIGAGQVAPRKARIMALALVIGLMIGIGIVLVRELMHQGFRSAGELEDRTGIAVLGQIPRIPVRARAKQIAWLTTRPASAVAEAVRNLRTSVLLSNVDRPAQVILTTSAVPGEGKTTVSIALAQNLAGLEKRVLLIEGDLRRRTFASYFPEATRQKGLLSVIAGDVPLAEALWHDPALKLDVLMGEKVSVNAADLLSSDRFRDFIAGIRESYDHIVIDTPPVLAVPDARVIAPLVDAVLFVVNWDRTSRGLVDDALKMLRTVNIPVTGLVLSQIDPKGMRRYGYGYRYGGYTNRMRRYYEG